MSQLTMKVLGFEAGQAFSEFNRLLLQDGSSFGIVSKSVQKLVGRLTLFQGISQVLSHRKQHNNKHLVLLDGIERAVQSVNLQLGSLRRSRFLSRSLP
jgi:hypothetical protein